MGRVLAGIAAFLLLVTGATLMWRGNAQEPATPPAPAPRFAAAVTAPPMTLAPIGQAPATTAATTADANKTGKADTHQPPLALAAPAPAKLKSDTKKTIATNTDKPNAGAIPAQPDATQRTGKPKQAPSGVDKSVDSDEKLLETMLQLMNRSPAKEADRKSSAK